MPGSNAAVNDAKRVEMSRIFKALKEKLGSTKAISDRLDISQARVNLFIRGDSMGNNWLRAKADALLKSLS